MKYVLNMNCYLYFCDLSLSCEFPTLDMLSGGGGGGIFDSSFVLMLSDYHENFYCGCFKIL